MVEQPEEFEVEAVATVNPSEDKSKVITALKNIIGEAEASIGEDGERVYLKTKDPRSLKHLKDSLRDRRIRAVAKRLVLESKKGNEFTILANKQAAYVGIISLCESEEESPLGAIRLRFKSADLDKLIEYLTEY